MSCEPDSASKDHLKGTGKFCELCAVFVPNEASLKAHLNGQKHKRNVVKQTEWKKKADLSLYVGGIKKLNVAELSLADYFSSFCIVKKITIDKTSKRYAIVELESREAVERILEHKHHTIAGVSVVVKSRELKSSVTHSPVKPNKTDVKEHVFHEMLLTELQDAPTVESQILMIEEKLQLTPEEVHLRDLICQLLQSALQEVFPGCFIKQFGSSANGFGVHGCDLDLHFQYETVHPDLLNEILSSDDEMSRTEDEKIKNLNEPSTSRILSAVAEIVKQCVPDCHKIKAILTARLPLVRFHHKASKMKCDVSLCNRLAVRNTEYLKFCWQVDPSFRSLVFVVRTWMKHWQLAGGVHVNGPRLNNYAVTLLVLFYLQNTGQFPTLKDMRFSMTEKTSVIDGCDCSFPSNIKSVSCADTLSTKNLVDKLSDFFVFYSKIEFDKIVLDLSTGNFLSISDPSVSHERDQSSPEAAGDGDIVPERPRKFKVGALNIRDPFEVDHNVAGNVNEKHMKSLTKHIRNAALATKMKRYHTKPHLGSEEWGVLNLFVDHHKKNVASTNGEKPKQSAECSFSIKSFKDNSDFNAPTASALVLTVLRDVFKIQLVFTEDETKNTVLTPVVTKQKPSEPCHTGESDDHSETTSETNETSYSRKRKASSDSCGYCKRTKLMLSPDNTDNLLSSSFPDTNLPYTVDCIATHKLWQGRRKVRRQLVQKDKSDLLELEKEVSRLLLTDAGPSSSDGSELHNVSSSSTDSASPLSNFTFSLTLKADLNNALLLQFTNDSNSADFMTFFHHIEAFLPSFVNKCLQQLKK